METETELDHLEDDNSMEINIPSSSASKSDQKPDELGKENEFDDGIAPLFSEFNQLPAKRVLDFDDIGDVGGLSEGNADFDSDKKRKNSVDLDDGSVKQKKKKPDSSLPSKTQKSNKGKSDRKEKKDRKARTAQHVDFQRVMRERKNVGFRPTPMVEKSISSVLEKIRQRKMEVSKKLMVSKKIELDEDSEEDDYITEILNNRPQKTVEIGTSDASLNKTSEDKSHSIDEQTNIDIDPPKDETAQSFRAPLNDTQDLFVDSEKIDSQGDHSNESSSSAQDTAPSVPSLNLLLDSAFADDISSSDEESDKENIEPQPKPLSKGSSTATANLVKDFLDEEAVEDDSDDLFEDKDEEEASDMEENCDYIVSNVVEKQIDHERNNQYHQQWQQQQDEARTEKLLQKLNCGIKQKEASSLYEDDADKADDERDESDKDVASHKDEDESDDDVSEEDAEGYIASGVTTKKLRQMIPQMFTDKDDMYVSSEGEETERSLSNKKVMIQKRGSEGQTKLLSTSMETSSEVFARIKKLNVVTEAKKKAKTSSIFNAVLSEGSRSNSSKSFLLRGRSSSYPGTSNRKQGSKTRRSFIFGRDDSNSRSAMSMPEDCSDLGQGEKENEVKKNSSGKYNRSSSQAKRSTQDREMEGGTSSSGTSSLFDMLKCPSVNDTYDTSAVDHQALFAAFKSVKKR
ncbi:uncharacterized protein LOC130798036 [Amaranthus tricolor]|uniref:uncharacterized protein LOC130798036 n=1 Tax=Amaranthus tricolor TaxID=29722 RepID=UPI00258F9E78|nr:uncharacterized protein LOC130798036 [Amaranthus tricolor]